MAVRRRVFITGVGVVCCLGDSLGALVDGLSQGGLAAGPVDPQFLDPHLAGRNTYPLDRPARLLTAAASLALADARIPAQRPGDRDIGLFVGTVFSTAHTIMRFDRQAATEGPALVSPQAFANTVINAPLGQAAIWHGLRGINRTFATGASSGLEAIACAGEVILSGRADCILAGGVEEVSDVSMRAFAASGLLSPSGRHRPYEPASDGMTLSEGAALLVLEEAGAAARRGATVLAEFLGCGRAFDVSQRTDERRSVRSVVHAFRGALGAANLGPGRVDAIFSAANGIPRLDRHEALALSAVFESEPEPPAICAVKGQIGEALGAGGSIQCAALIGSLRRGCVPTPLVVCATPTGVVAVRPQDAPVRAGEPRIGLISSLSFDGHSSALALASSSVSDSLDAT